ncbi:MULTISPECIES: hypothetical protein [Bacillus]|nr:MULTISPECIES: hypothetical protein [Bacillus]MCU5489664.1 hypothetical protein [Bacillus cereus]MDA1871916.1 hypothetical protein [Bacillus cereus]MED3269781.1 hypothetical protein [Bacillus thuringiensis]QWS01207.1 hypothetical protein IMY50_29890 [Bacillus cereus]SHM86395.1 hypothetical protein SAMN04487918_1212 [Bacillus sp. bc15]
MNKNKYTVLTKEELLKTDGGKAMFIASNATYYPQKWNRELGKWIASKIK